MWEEEKMKGKSKLKGFKILKIYQEKKIQAKGCLSMSNIGVAWVEKILTFQTGGGRKNGFFINI